MEMITIAKFNEYLREKQPKTIIFNDDNNSEYKHGYIRRAICQPSYISLVFNNIIVTGREITLRCNNGYISLNYIDKIKLEIESVLGDIVTIYCKYNDASIAYVLIIR